LVKGLAASANGALTDPPPVAWFGLVGTECSVGGRWGDPPCLHIVCYCAVLKLAFVWCVAVDRSVPGWG